MSERIIFLDMDGVCADFVGAALEACGHPELAPIRCWDMSKQMGITVSEFWRRIDAKGIGFWEGLQEYHWFNNMYDSLCRQGEVYFVSAPSNSIHSFSGKAAWLKGRFSPHFNRLIFTQHKHLLAGGPGERVLIDDNEKNCKSFREHGGRAILFPQTWNGADPDSFVEPWEVLV